MHLELKNLQLVIFCMTKFMFEGRLDTGRAETPFEREVEADAMDHGREKIYSQLGSEHSVTRSKITIKNGEEA